jgi:hypothetical protein
MKRTFAALRMENLRLPAQQAQLERIATLKNFRGGCIDMTGIGLGLVEYSQEEKWGRDRIVGVDFSTTEPLTDRLRRDGRQGEKARVTEIMATDLLGDFEDRCIEIPMDPELRDDLRKPERLVSADGKRVSIAAERDEAGHADHFWALALARRAATSDWVTHMSAGNIGAGAPGMADVMGDRWFGPSFFVKLAFRPGFKISPFRGSGPRFGVPAPDCGPLMSLNGRSAAPISVWDRFGKAFAGMGRVAA